MLEQHHDVYQPSAMDNGIVYQPNPTAHAEDSCSKKFCMKKMQPKEFVNKHFIGVFVELKSKPLTRSQNVLQKICDNL